MLGRLQCNSCGATWPNPKVTGLIYAHVCPKEIVDTPETVDPVTHAILTPVKFKATPNPRNENLKRDPARPGEFVLISEGSGVTEI